MCDFLSQIDFCIKTYLRPKACDNLVTSIRRFYPDAHITTNSHPEIHTGRNALVKGTKRPYLLFLDDDFLFTEETDVSLLAPEMADKRIGVAGGVVMDCSGQNRVQRHSGGLMTLEDKTLRIWSRLRGTMASKWCDMVPNFCIIRRDVFDTCQYRWGIGAEHADFFLQVRDAGWKVCQVDECRIDHDLHAPDDPGYKAARWNIAANVLAFMNHWDIDTVLVNGRVAHNRPGFLREREVVRA